MKQIHDDKKSLRLKPPAYPFDASQLFGDLRNKLSKGYPKQLSFDQLALIIGKAKSTTHHWFELSEHPHILALMCLLERLPPVERHAWVDKFCRSFPRLEDLKFGESHEQLRKLRELLRQKNGLTIVVGGIEAAREFLISAMGHSYCRSALKQTNVAGIALHVPITIVPLETLNYIDPNAGEAKVKQLILKEWPRILTSRGKLVVLDGVWSRLPELHSEIAECSHRNHVITSERKMPDLRCFKIRPRCPLNLVMLSVNRRAPGDLRISIRRFNHVQTADHLTT